ncbi:MAG: hypothetical protein KJ607_06200 [Bacteroidetes bacterium]|nr:hypothetical protein [Bacteroidota bacterium]
MKKRLSYLILATLLLSIPLLSGCFKVGDEDPFISFRTRKARVIGKWNISEWNFDVTITDQDGWKLDSIFSLSGESTSLTEQWHQHPAHKDTSHEWSGEVIDANFNFDEDGEMKLYVVYRIHRDSSASNEDGWTWDYFWENEYRFDFSGTWNFMDKIDNYKKKERITLVWMNMITTVNYTYNETVTDPDGNADLTPHPGQLNEARKYSNGQVAEIWRLVQLRNKSIKLERDINDDWVYKYQDIENPMTSSSLVTIGSESMTLSAVQ